MPCYSYIYYRLILSLDCVCTVAPKLMFAMRNIGIYVIKNFSFAFSSIFVVNLNFSQETTIITYLNTYKFV